MDTGVHALDRRTAIRHLAEAIVTATAPREAELFPTLFGVYEHLEPEELLSVNRWRGDERLGSGIDIATSVMTAGAIVVAQQVIDYVAQATLGGLHGRARRRAWWHRRPRWLRRDRNAAAASSDVTVTLPVDLPAGQVRTGVAEAARYAGVTDEQVDVIVEAVMRIVVGPPEEPADEPVKAE